MRKVLVYNPGSCTGCRSCELACSLRHKGVSSRSQSLIRIATDDKEFISRASFCRQCRRPVCMELCPVDAVSRDEETGLVSVDSRACIGCGLCLECPLGGMHLAPATGLAENCDLCRGSPACVEFCAAGALQFLPPGEARASRAARDLTIQWQKGVSGA